MCRMVDNAVFAVMDCFPTNNKYGLSAVNPHFIHLDGWYEGTIKIL